MSEATCAVLVGVFPVVLLTIAVEGRLIGARARVKLVYRTLALGGIGASLAGLVFAVVGVQLEGLNGVASIVLWLVAALAATSFGGLMLLIAAAADNDAASEVYDEMLECARQAHLLELAAKKYELEGDEGKARQLRGQMRSLLETRPGWF